MRCHRLEFPTSWGTLRLIGGSRAGEGTLLMLPQFRLAIEAGRAQRKLPAMSTLFISHGHADHLLAVAYWASQRALSRLGRGRILAPQAIASDLVSLLECHAGMEGEAPYDVEVTALSPQSEFQLKPGIRLEFFKVSHRVPTLGCRMLWSRKQLRPELSGADEAEIRRQKEAGIEITTRVEQAILSYSADTGVRVFENPEHLAAEILLLECSFWGENDRERARRYAHLHLEDILENIHLISARHLVLFHASRRNRLHEVRKLIDRRLRPATDAEIHDVMVEWE